MQRTILTADGNFNDDGNELLNEANQSLETLFEWWHTKQEFPVSEVYHALFSALTSKLVSIEQGKSAAKAAPKQETTP